MNKIKRIMDIYHMKIIACLCFIEQLAKLNTEYCEQLPAKYKEKFIEYSKNYILRYKELILEDANDKEEAEE